MGVRRILQWPSSSPSEITKDLQTLQEKLDALGARRVSGKWKAAVALYHRKKLAPGFKQQEMYMVRMSEWQENVYIYVKNERESKGKPQTEAVLLEAAKDGVLILQKLDIYTLKLESSMEGFSYELGDFEIKIGVSKTRASVLQGILVEVHYKPCMLARSCWAMINELLACLGSEGRITTTAADEKQLSEAYIMLSLPPKYCPRHSAIQYIHAFSKFL